MKLVTFHHELGHDRAGALVGDQVVDLARAFAFYEHSHGRRCDEAHVFERYGRGVLGFVERAEHARPAADEIVEMHARGALPPTFEGAPLTTPLAKVTLSAPIPRPPSMRDGYAFRQHVETARRNRGLDMIPEFDQFPIFYFTNHAAVTGPGDVHVRPRHTERLDFELEAAIVVGREARDVTAKEADDLVFGLTIMNDWSARALQMEEMKLNLGPAKGKDFATSLGPWLVTVDELRDRTQPSPGGNRFDLAMRARVNGKELSRGNVKDMTWTFAQILERASYGVTLHPGDVVGSGTCGTGCLLELNGSKITDNLWLKPGDVVELEIDRLGVLSNKVVLDNR
ncbi:MAG TPA: fumarylacetoacetate hydrolase family protein [Polyangiaceae bacterium]|jgi:fumarylacetoacetate (FAA) hydrolase